MIKLKKQTNKQANVFITKQHFPKVIKLCTLANAWSF